MNNKFRDYMNTYIHFSTGLKIICLEFIIGLLIISLVLLSTSGLNALNCSIFGISLLLLLTLIIFQFHTQIHIVLRSVFKFISFVLYRTFRFILSNIFVICVCLSILYVGNNLILTLEKVNNIVPVAIHDGYAIYDRSEDKFFEYKSTQKGRFEIYYPSYEVEEIHKKYYKTLK